MLRFWKKRRRPHGWRPPSFPARHRLCWRYDVCVRHDSHCPRDAQIREPPRNNYFLVIITFVMDPLSPLRAREGQAVVGPLLRGRSPTRSVAPKQPGGSGVLLSGFRARAWVPRNLARRNFGLLVSRRVKIYWFRRRDAARPDRAAWEVPRVNPSCHPYARARARPWSARCYGVARQRDRSRQNSRGARACFSPAFRARAWVPRNLARRNFGLLVSRRVKIYWFRRRDAARPDRAACRGAPR